jgi:hypothetical protein
MRKLFSLTVTLMLAAIVHAQDYAVSAIPAALLKNANVVKRTERVSFDITSGNKGYYRYKVAYTILNEQGDRWSSFSEGYDKLSSIESLEGSLYGADGRKIKSLKKSDIGDVSGVSDGLMDDNRVKYHSFFYKLYPFTVEYEVEMRYKGTMFLPPWMPQEKPEMSVQESYLTISTPATNPLHYKMSNYKGEPSIKDDKSGKVYSWEIKNLPVLPDEYASPAWRELTTNVFMASENFVLEDYKGSNASWKDFGLFIWDLKKDRDALPDDIKQKVHQLTDGLTDVNKKIEVLYKFMQQNSRYISIQLGIGGWQPFDAKFVASRKYGDCKALSNYMYALLKEAGIRSVYTVIYRGSDNNRFFADLPSSQFNHVILFVPNNKDTVWLECTSQTVAAGYLDGSTQDRYALAVDENGGVLVKTPGYKVNDNLQQRSIEAVIDEKGNLDAHIHTKYKAKQQDDLHELINGLSKDKLMEFLKEGIELPSYDIRKFDYATEKEKIPVISESLELIANNYAAITGKRLFLTPNIMTRHYRKLSENEERKFEIKLTYEYRDIDTVKIQLPAGYEPESIPQEVTISSPFGKYNCSVKLTGNTLYYYRSMEQYEGRFPAGTYSDLVKFYNAVYKADRNKVVLVKKSE